jgi:hypothetical protein
MSLALLRKELKEHGWVLLAVLVLSTAGLLLFVRHSDEWGGRFAVFQHFTESFLLVCITVAANRLVVREYGGKTQLFLEALPLARWKVFATKWLSGAAWTSTVLTSAWFVSLVMQRRHEVISWRDALWAFQRAFAFALAFWSFSFLAGMLGRFRYTVWLSLLLLIFGADTLAHLSLVQLPVIRLIDSDLGLSNAPPPFTDLLAAIAVLVFCTATSASLALLGEGTVATALAQKMTPREKVFVGCMMLTAIFLVSELNEHKTVPPFELKDSAMRRTSFCPVGVMPTREVPRADADALAGRLADDLVALSKTMDLPSHPGVYVMPRSGLDPWVILQASLKNNDGLVLQAPVGAKGFDLGRLRAFVVHGVLSDQTRSRATKEDRHWFLDGFALWWVARDDEQLRRHLLLRASASPEPITVEQLTHWASTSERLGECLAGALAYQVVATLAEEKGDDAVLAVARRLFIRPPRDARAMLWNDPSLERLLKEQGTSTASLAEDAERLRQETRTQQTATLAELPNWNAEVTLEHEGGKQSKVVVHRHGDRLPESWRALFVQLSPWDGEQNDVWLSRLDILEEQAVLPVTAIPGQRYLVATEYDDATLACPVRVSSVRLEVP